MLVTKKRLAITLSKLKVFSSPDIRLEQYPTDSEIAAETMWDAYMKGDIAGKIVADFGCGTGILGISALMLGANRVFFIDTDEKALSILKENLASLELDSGFEIINSDISLFDAKVDTVIQNPPFGVKSRHADSIFLEKAFACADAIYSFHKTETEDFVMKKTAQHGFYVSGVSRFSFPLKSTYSFHAKRIVRIDVSCVRMIASSKKI